MSQDENQNEDDEKSESKMPTRGTASRGNPLYGSAATGPEESVIKIQDPTSTFNKVRVYELNDEVKEYFEGCVSSALDEIADWHDTWWEGTELVVEFQGHVRSPDDKSKESSKSRQEKMQEMMQGKDDENTEKPDLPPFPKPPSSPRQGIPQMSLLLAKIYAQTAESKDDIPEPKGFDEGIIKQYSFARIDLQEYADESPLKFEDILILLDQEPVEEVEPTQDSAPDLSDFREMDDKNETLPEGARGNRYHL